MRILALDSSGVVATVAIVEEDKVLCEYTVDYKKTHSQTLLPMVEQIASMTDTKLENMDAIAISAGPGSFTGLRIGAATAKGLALSINKPLISIPTLEALAYNMFETEAIICPIMDARRSQVYTGCYEWREHEFCVILEQRAMTIQETVEEMKKTDRNVIFLGDAVPVHKFAIQDALGEKAVFAPMHLCKQRASAVGALAVQYYIQKKIMNADEFEPVYLRLSQAERELALKRKSGDVHEA